MASRARASLRARDRLAEPSRDSSRGVVKLGDRLGSKLDIRRMEILVMIPIAAVWIRRRLDIRIAHCGKSKSLDTFLETLLMYCSTGTICGKD